MTVIKIPLKDKDFFPQILSSNYGLSADSYKIKEDSDFVYAEIEKPQDKDTFVKIIISDDETSAFLSLYPFTGNGKSLSLEEIWDKINQSGVTFQIISDSVDNAFSNQSSGIITESILISKGSQMFPGKDAVVTLQFSVVDRKPKITEDGKVDYKNIDNIVQVSKGDILVVKRPATLGIKGISVKGLETLPPPGIDVLINCGKGVSVNSLETVFTAATSGYVEFSNNKISINELYYVDKNVDFSTGNIKFNGTVHIKGDVMSGFRVEAEGDVIVDGICVDCDIIAGGNIVVKTGIKCTGTNSFRAEGDIRIGYCEKARIFAKGNITIGKYAYNCELYSGEVIEAVSVEGIVAGGIVKAYNEVRVKQLGTQGNSNFSVYMGTKYFIDQAIERLHRQRADIMDALSRVGEVLKNFTLSKKEIAENTKIAKLLSVRDEMNSTLSEMDAKEIELKNQSKAESPKIKVFGSIHEGVTIMFFGSSKTVKELQENIVYYYNKKYSEVSQVSLKDAKNFEFD